MTPRERVLAVLERRVPDRLPRELQLTPPLLEAFERAPARPTRPSTTTWTCGTLLLAADGNARLQPPTTPRACRACGIRRAGRSASGASGVTPGSLLHFIHIEHPMLNRRHHLRAEAVPVPRPHPAGAPRAILKAQVEALHDRGLFVIGFMEWTIFEIAWHMRGMEKLFSDIVVQPAVRRVPAGADHRDPLLSGAAYRRGGRRPAQDRRRRRHAAIAC